MFTTQSSKQKKQTHSTKAQNHSFSPMFSPPAFSLASLPPASLPCYRFGIRVTTRTTFST